MNEKENLQDLELPNDLPEGDLPDIDLDEILKEFSPGDAPVMADDPELEEAPEEHGQTMTEDTVRIELPQRQSVRRDLEDTIRLENIEQLAQETQKVTQETPQEPAAEPVQEAASEKAEPFSEKWQPEYEQPMGEYVPPQPIVFHPRSRLRELKRKLVAGPERRYYEINEMGFGKLQIAMFLCFLLVVLSAGATAMYAMGMVSAKRIKLMVFCQFFAMLASALLGSFQLMEGVADLFKGRFSLNTMLVFTFAACCVDGVLCLREQRIPCCAVFCLQVLMSMWNTYHRRGTEMAMMDTLRKAVHLDGIKLSDDYFDNCAGLLREEGKLEDFMDQYQKSTRPEKVFYWYGFIALLVSIGIAAIAYVLHGSISFSVQVLSVSLMAAIPVTSFITLSRPMAVLERRLHKLGTVLCGWRGVVGLSCRAVFPLTHEDLFPVGSCKLNGVKFYGSRDPDEVVAYCSALVTANGGGLVPLFDHLLSSRNGRHYTVESLRGYNGGIGGEILGESVLMGNLNFLKEMGVEIPEGTSVSQAVYAAIDGELCGVFAVTYAKLRASATGLRTLCAYRGLRPVMVTGDFMLTEEFIRGKFSINTRRVCFPQGQVRRELAAVEADPEAPALALITSKGLAPYAYAITGARSLRTASWIGVVIHLLGGILGLAMMAALAVLGEGRLLTPSNLLLYELVWIIPGFLITEWTRSV